MTDYIYPQIIAVKFGLCNFTNGPHMSQHFPPVLISISVYMKHVEVNVVVSDAVVNGGLNWENPNKILLRGPHITCRSVFVAFLNMINEKTSQWTVNNLRSESWRFKKSVSCLLLRATHSSLLWVKRCQSVPKRQQ